MMTFCRGGCLRPDDAAESAEDFGRVPMTPMAATKVPAPATQAKTRIALRGQRGRFAGRASVIAAAGTLVGPATVAF